MGKLIRNILILVFFMGHTCWAADQVLSDKTAATSASDTDLIYVLVDPAGTPLDRKVTKANFLKVGTDIQGILTNEAGLYAALSDVSNFLMEADFSANGYSLVTAANYAAMRGLLDLEAGTDFYSISAADSAFETADAAIVKSDEAETLSSAWDMGTPSALIGTNISTMPYSGLADGTDGNLITWAADASIAVVATGTAGQVLTSNGAGAAPTMQASGAGATDWSDIGDATADSVIAFGDNEITELTLADTNEDMFTISGQGAFGDVSVVKIQQETGNATDGTVLEIVAADANVDPLVVSASGQAAALVVAQDTGNVSMGGDLTVTGTVTATGGLNTGTSTDPYLGLLVTDADDTDWWIGVNADAGASSDDDLEFRTNATPGTNEIIALEPDTGDLVFNGATDDAHKMRFDITDPTDTRTVTWDNNNVNFGHTTEDYILKYNAATRTWAGEADATGGTTALHDIGDPVGVTSITLADGETVTWLGSADNEVFFSFQDDAAALAAATTLIDLNFSAATYDLDSDAIYLNMQDYTTTAYTFSGSAFSSYRPIVSYEGNVAGSGYTAFTASQVLEIMDGAGDFCRGYLASWTNVDHTGGNLHAFDAEDITGDADASEKAFRVGTGWDHALYAESGDIGTIHALDWDMIDNNASALSIDAAGKAGILSITTTDGSEGVAMSGALSVTGALTPGAITSTGTIESSGTYDITGAGGMTLGSGDVSAFTFSGASETLIWTPTADLMTVTTGTGIAEIDFSAMALHTTGVIKGRLEIGADITANTAHDLAECHNTAYMATAAATVTLDAAADAGFGSTVSYWVRDAAEAFVIDCQVAEKINLDGVAQAAGVAITATGVTSKATLMAVTDTDGSGTDGWIVWSHVNFASE